MKVMTILGTRPEIIRLSLVIPKLDAACEHTLVHTGQNFEQSLGDVFFQELEIRQPDVFMGVRADTFSGQIAHILEKSEEVFRKYSPEDMEAYLKRLHAKPTASGKQKRKRGPGGRSAN